MDIIVSRIISSSHASTGPEIFLKLSDMLHIICIMMMFLVKTSYPCKENGSGIAVEANFFFSSFLDVSVAFQNSERDPRTFLNTGFIEQYYIFWLSSMVYEGWSLISSYFAFFVPLVVLFRLCAIRNFRLGFLKDINQSVIEKIQFTCGRIPNSVMRIHIIPISVLGN